MTQQIARFVDDADARRALARQNIVTLLGYTDEGYDVAFDIGDEDDDGGTAVVLVDGRQRPLADVVLEFLNNLPNKETFDINLGGYTQGIGQLHALLKQNGFNTIAIVGSDRPFGSIATEPQQVYVVNNVAKIIADVSRRIAAYGGGMAALDVLEQVPREERRRKVTVTPAKPNVRRALPIAIGRARTEADTALNFLSNAQKNNGDGDDEVTPSLFAPLARLYEQELLGVESVNLWNAQQLQTQSAQTILDEFKPPTCAMCGQRARYTCPSTSCKYCSEQCLDTHLSMHN